MEKDFMLQKLKGETKLLMKNNLLFCAIFIASVVTTVSAQNSSLPTLTNFETAKSVNAYVPPPPEVIVKAVPEKDKKNQAGQSGSANSNVKLTAMNRRVVAPSMLMSAGKTLGSFSTGDAKVDSYILDSTARYGVDPLLVYATMSQESSFKPQAISYKGARGLMQLMPATAARFGVSNIFDPRQNIEGGVKYLRFLLDTFNGDVRLALAGYNAGEGAVMKYGYTIPPYAETQNYVARISARYEMVRDPNYVRSILRVNSAPPTGKNVKSVKAVPLPPPPPIYTATTIVTKLSNNKIVLTNQ
ncbi:MAG: lytic transglycosylase domain-containing protein [Pyrinomonadaceae bacterium]